MHLIYAENRLSYGPMAWSVQYLADETRGSVDIGRDGSLQGHNSKLPAPERTKDDRIVHVVPILITVKGERQHREANRIYRLVSCTMEMPQKAGFGRIDNESETSFCSYAPVRCPIHPFLPVGTSAMFKGPLKRLLKITAVDILLPPSDLVWQPGRMRRSRMCWRIRRCSIVI